MSKADEIKKIEEEGYRAAINGESKASHQYRDRQRRKAFDIGYYKGTLELSRKIQAEKEAQNGKKSEG